MHCSDGTVVLLAITGLFSFSLVRSFLLRPFPVDDFCASLFDFFFVRSDRLSYVVDLFLFLPFENAVEVFDQRDLSMPDCPHISKLQIILTIPAVGPPLPHGPCGRESEQERQSNAPFHQPFVDIIIPRYSFLEMLQRTMDPVPVPVEHRFVAIYVL